ncbi:MAG: hypothetical protein KBC36_02920 [Spirochaetia bacterium]|nr:hypothetical protein [Spirochaetia bacterium]
MSPIDPAPGGPGKPRPRALPPLGVCERVAFYCEENVHRLLGRPELAGRPAWALVVSNADRVVPMLRQLAGQPPDGLVLWDYHVVALVADARSGARVLDLDAMLGFPLPLKAWLRSSFAPRTPPRLRPRFRLIPAEDYLAGLVSDRSHMLNADGSWKAPPPSWPAPGADSGRPNTLLDWVDLEKPGPGLVTDLRGLAAFPFSARTSVP